MNTEIRRVFLTATLIGCFIEFTGASALIGQEEETREQQHATPFRLMSDAKDARLREHLPKVLNDGLKDIFKDERLLLYTETEMPRAYQDWDGALQGIHSAYYNISADRSEPFGNANREFPWGHPAGTHRTSGLKTFRFLWLPKDGEGKTLPVVWFPKFYRGDNSSGYGWTFPVGAIVGEVLMLPSPNYDYYCTFEVRLRIREKGDWAVDVYRPYSSAEDLAKRITELRPNWKDSEKLTHVINSLLEKKNLTVDRLVDFHPRRSFDETMGEDYLPSIEDEKLVVELLTKTPFQSVLGKPWRYGKNNKWTAAPTTSADFHIVPANYDAGFVEVDRESCIRCHETVGMHVRDFQFGRDWYGRVRGSDGIFSFHPFHPAYISGNGSGGRPLMRGDMIEGGVLARYNQRIHPVKYYNKAMTIEN